MLNGETQELYLMMYDILHRMYFEEKEPIYAAARAMIAAIDKCGNLPVRC